MIYIHIDKSSGKPLYIQIRDRIEQAVKNGELKPGDRLPPVSAFARKVGVTQATIRRALEDLADKGVTESHVGRGTFIRETAADSLQPAGGAGNPMGRQPVPEMPGTGGGRHDGRMAGQGGYKGICDLINMARKPQAAVFAKGIPDPGSVDAHLMQQAVRQVLSDHPYGYMDDECSQGLPALRREIAGRYREKGYEVNPDQVLITNGSQQGAAILALDWASRSGRVICEAPCFQGIADTFSVHGNRVDTVLRDEDGPIPDTLCRLPGPDPRLFVLCPELHSPMGTDISPGRQQAVADWARQTNAVLVCDEIYQDLRYEGRGPDSFFRLMGDEQVVVISSMSKTLMSGLRLGWMIASPGRIAGFSRLKRLMDQACPPMMQGVALQLFRSGLYDAHVKKIREVYRKRRDLVLESLEKTMPNGVSWTIPKGGFSLWVTLPRGYAALNLLLAAIDRGVNFLPGPMFDTEHRFVNQFRISWAWAPRAAIPDGIKILAGTVKELMKKAPGTEGVNGLGHFQ